MTGVQYRMNTALSPRGGTQLGALRAGGFATARMGQPFKISLASGGSNTAKSTVQVAATASAVTSSHMASLSGLTRAGKAWGNGANGSGAGPVIALECTTCHNPHGNGQYAILQSLPTATGLSNAWTIKIVSVSAAGLYTTDVSSGLHVGDAVTVAGATQGNGSGTVATTPATNTFTLTGVTVAAAGTGGTVTRTSGVMVTDAALPASTDARNYTVIQTVNTSTTPPTNTSLYASQIVSAGYGPLTGDYFRRAVPWNALIGSVNDAPNGIAASVAGTSTVSFNEQMNLWCASCHTRYFAYRNPTTNPANGTVTNSYKAARPGDSLFMYQHATRDTSPGCNTCHVAHGSSAVMNGFASANVPFPDTSVSVGDSRLLKVGNRGTCQMCHDPTNTFTQSAGTQYPPAPYPIPSAP